MYIEFCIWLLIISFIAIIIIIFFFFSLRCGAAGQRLPRGSKRKEALSLSRTTHNGVFVCAARWLVLQHRPPRIGGWFPLNGPHVTPLSLSLSRSP